jgi:hypothetical protein
MTTPWTYAGSPPALSHADSTVTLVDGQTFCLSAPGGDFVADLPHGLFVLDTRVLSRWELRVNGHYLEPLAAAPHAPFEASFIGCGHPRPGPGGRRDPRAPPSQHRRCLCERIVVRNYGLDPPQRGRRWVIDGLLGASAASGGRLPELFAGLARSEMPTPVM